MTKVIVIGQENPKDKKMPIEFRSILAADLTIQDAECSPSDYKFIELICKDYNDHGDDLMFVYNDSKYRGNGVLYIGRFNNGIV